MNVDQADGSPQDAAPDRPPNAQRLAPSAQRPVLAGLLAGLVGQLVYGLTDAVTLGAKPGYLLWMVFAVIVIAASPSEHDTPG